MNKYARIKWYRFKVANAIRLLEGEELIKTVEEFIKDIKSKKLDKIGLFKILLQDLDQIIKDAKFAPKKKAREHDPFYIPRSGDGRIALFGVSNVGKSTLMNAITNTDVKTGNYLNTTRRAHAGTLEYEQLKIQIVDLPGFLDFKEDWAISKQIVRVARSSDAILIVIDLSTNVEQQYNFLIQELEKTKIIVNGDSIYKIGIVATKGDIGKSKENYQYLLSKTKTSKIKYPIYPVSVEHPDTLEKLKKDIFEMLDVIRVTTRVWGPSVDFPGQHVGLEHELKDTDVVEILVNRK